MSRARIPYPWISMLTALLIIIWQLLLAKPEWIRPYGLPEPMLKTEFLLSASLLWVLLALYEIHRFYRAWAGYRAHIAELFDSRRELGTRVRT